MLSLKKYLRMQKNPQNTHEIECFLRGEKNLVVPFNLEYSDFKYVCTKVLRLLPFKRLSLEANNANDHVVIKLFALHQKGIREFDKEKKGHHLASFAGISVPEILLTSEQIDGCLAIVYKYIENTIHFTLGTEDIYLDRITHLYDFLAKTHAYGIYQDDSHLGNFLLQGSNIYLIDLGSVVCEHQGIPLSVTKSLANLSKLIVQFYSSEQDLLIQHIDLYFQARAWQPNDREMVQFYAQIDKAWNKRKKEYINKCYRNCTITTYEYRFTHELAFRTNFLESISINIHEKIEQLMLMGKVLKAGNSATVVLVNIDGLDYVIKRYNIKNIVHFLRRFWRPSRATISWKSANLLELIGISTPRPLGFIEKRFGPFRVGVSYFISEYEETESLLKTYSKRPPTKDELVKVSNLFKTLKKYKISHGDFKASNLLIDNQGNISLIDLDSMLEHKNNKLFLQAHDKDIKRFLRNWSDENINNAFKKILL